MEFKFILGEHKSVSFEVYSTKNEFFVIDKATFELFLDDSVEDSGNCRVEEHIISVLLNPKTKSTLYYLVITYCIAEEVFKKKVEMVVE